MGHMQTMQTQIRHCMMRCLIRILTVCLHNVLLKFGKKKEKYHQTTLNWKWTLPIVKGRSVHSA